MNKNKILTLTALTLVVAGTLVGCGNKTETPDINENQTNQEVLIDDNEEAQDVKVEEKEITYYVPNDNVDGLKKITLKGNLTENIENPQFLIDKFIEEGFIAKGTKVNKFKQVSEDVYNLDLSSEFYELNFGSSAEALLLDSIANSFIEKFDIEKLKLTVDGDNYTSGHIILEDNDYLTFTELTENSTEEVINID